MVIEPSLPPMKPLRFRSIHQQRANCNGALWLSFAESLTLDGVLIDALVELTTGYVYDEAGRLVRLVYPGGEEALRVYSGRGELEEVKLRFSPTHAWGSIAHHEYDAAGQLTKQTWGHNGTSHYEHDASGRMSRVTHKRNSSSVIVDYEYIRNPAGDLVERTDKTSRNRHEVYEHDPAHRFSAVRRGGDRRAYRPHLRGCGRR